jgi:hypothetical protein
MTEAELFDELIRRNLVSWTIRLQELHKLRSAPEKSADPRQPSICDHEVVWAQCGNCYGAGKLDTPVGLQRCMACEGTGKVRVLGVRDA